MENIRRERRRILIWGKTRPELSKKYREIVCTGGIFEDTKRLVRLYPIPLRYMEDEKIFKKYQWIEASVIKATNDPRPESYRISCDNIVLGDVIPSKNNWEERAKWVLNNNNIFNSVESLQQRQQQDRTSLGLVKPLKIIDVTKHEITSKEQSQFLKSYEEVMLQIDFSSHEVKPLRPPDYKFKVHFRCDDGQCPHNGHKFSILDWEIDALYFNLRKKNSREVAANKVIGKLRDDVFAPDKDLYFYLGNISNYPHTFTVVGLWYPKKKQQTTLFS